MYKLKLKHNNAVIDVILSYRQKAKETSALIFIPFRNPDGSLGTIQNKPQSIL